MLRHGLSPKVVADRLGHASTRMTLDVYSHVMPGIESDAAEKVDLALRDALGQQSGQQNMLTVVAGANELQANPCGTRLFRGGRNRARTCDPLLVSYHSGDFGITASMPKVRAKPYTSKGGEDFQISPLFVFPRRSALHKWSNKWSN